MCARYDLLGTVLATTRVPQMQVGSRWRRCALSCENMACPSSHLWNPGEKTSAKVKRLKRSFLLDYPKNASREDATLLLDDIEAGLDNSIDAEDLKSQIRAVRRDFALDDEPMEPVTDFAAFRDAIDNLVYREINLVQAP
ncbi:hypothetical protein [Dactylosporangium sp. NPDC000521]|uniref:hypothetical protein n=1 Tax=Dactylosporangium sp. NPDC000521 TaxID=3363975 RepID=UPI0036CEB8CE